MKTNLARLLLPVLALAALEPVQAYSCRLSCASTEACVLAPRPDGSAALHLPHSSSECENLLVPVLQGRVSVWYLRDNIIVAKLLDRSGKVADAIKDGSQTCRAQPLSGCVGRVERNRVPGLSPMFKARASDGTEALGPPAPAALPFDDVLIAPNAVLRLQLSPQAREDGELSLLDSANPELRIRIPIRAGVAEVPAASLQEARRYLFIWKTPSAHHAGSFTPARSGTVARVERSVQAAIEDPQRLGEPELVRARVLSEGGFHWNAREVLRQLEETQP